MKNILNKIRYLVVPSEENGHRSTFLQGKFLLYLVVALLVLKVGFIMLSINLPQNIFFADITKFALQNFVNQTRQSFGLAPLTENEKLMRAAELKAENMVRDQYFDHTSPSGISPWFWFKQAGYNYKYAGENLAIGFYESEEVYNAWLNSPSHRDNIVNSNYTEVGTAVLGGFGPNNTLVVVQEFGSPSLVKKPATTVVTNTKPVPTTKQVVTKTIEAPKLPEQTEVKQETETIESVVKEEVLSESVQPKNSIDAPATNVTNSVAVKFLNSVLYDYNQWLQNIIYGVSLIVIGILLSFIFFNFKINFKRELVFRSLLIVVLLSAATMLNKELIISLIPHQIII